MVGLRSSRISSCTLRAAAHRLHAAYLGVAEIDARAVRAFARAADHDDADRRVVVERDEFVAQPPDRFGGQCIGDVRTMDRQPRDAAVVVAQDRRGVVARQRRERAGWGHDALPVASARVSWSTPACRSVPVRRVDAERVEHGVGVGGERLGRPAYRSGRAGKFGGDARAGVRVGLDEHRVVRGLRVAERIGDGVHRPSRRRRSAAARRCRRHAVRRSAGRAAYRAHRDARRASRWSRTGDRAPARARRAFRRAARTCGCCRRRSRSACPCTDRRRTARSRHTLPVATGTSPVAIQVVLTGCSIDSAVLNRSMSTCWPSPERVRSTSASRTLDTALRPAA